MENEIYNFKKINLFLAKFLDLAQLAVEWTNLLLVRLFLFCLFLSPFPEFLFVERDEYMLWDRIRHRQGVGGYIRVQT